MFAYRSNRVKQAIVPPPQLEYCKRGLLSTLFSELPFKDLTRLTLYIFLTNQRLTCFQIVILRSPLLTVAHLSAL